MKTAAHTIPYARLLRRYRAKAFVRSKVKLNSTPAAPPVTPELLKQAGGRKLDQNHSIPQSAEPVLGLDDKQRISILEREVQLIRQNIVQLWLRR